MKALRKKKNVIQHLDETPLNHTPALCPINLLEQKERFLKFGLLPRFQLKGSSAQVEKLSRRKHGVIGFRYFNEAKNILDMVRTKYGDATHYQEEAFGPRIDQYQGSEILSKYLKSNNLEGAISISWCGDLSCSARMVWCGPNVKYNKPEDRKYRMWIKSSTENIYLRERGILCLADHEIGTHFLRALNDGLQPWFSDRNTFGLCSAMSARLTATEEGLAAINTLMQANIKYLWGPALLYYTSCMANEMTFHELFDHLGGYVADPEQRWKHVMRVKRGLDNVNDLGGYGRDQCYFEGAVEILRNLDNIDFNVMYSGKICFDEVSRVKRLARLNFVRYPAFMQNLEKYRKMLKQIGILNGLIVESPVRKKSGNKGDKTTQSRKTFRYSTPTKPSKRSKWRSENGIESKSSTPDRLTPCPPKLSTSNQMHPRKLLLKEMSTKTLIHTSGTEDEDDNVDDDLYFNKGYQVSSPHSRLLQRAVSTPNRLDFTITDPVHHNKTNSNSFYDDEEFGIPERVN